MAEAKVATMAAAVAEEKAARAAAAAVVRQVVQTVDCTAMEKWVVGAREEAVD